MLEEEGSAKERKGRDEGGGGWRLSSTCTVDLFSLLPSHHDNLPQPFLSSSDTAFDQLNPRLYQLV